MIGFAIEVASFGLMLSGITNYGNIALNYSGNNGDSALNYCTLQEFR